MTIHKKLFSFDFISEPELLDEIEKVGVYCTYKPDEVIIKNERYIREFPLIIKGTVKVSRVDENGNELFLYYITAGQTCAISMSDHLADRQSCIRAVAEEETELISIPVASASNWYAKFKSWRTFVLMTMCDRFGELMKTLDNIAFTKTDERLMTFLFTKSKALNTNIIHITHQEIANELSTSREVISRLLKRLELEQELKLFRNKIELNVVV